MNQIFDLWTIKLNKRGQGLESTLRINLTGINEYITVMIKGNREYPEELFIDDLFKISNKEEFKDEYRIGTRIKKDSKILTVQCITINKKLMIDLKDKIEMILYEKGGTVLEEKED